MSSTDSTKANVSFDEWVALADEVASDNGTPLSVCGVTDKQLQKWYEEGTSAFRAATRSMDIWLENQ